MIENESMWTPDGQLKEAQVTGSLFPETQVEEPEQPEMEEEHEEELTVPTQPVTPKKGSYEENLANLRKKTEDLEYRLRKQAEEIEAERARASQAQQQYYQQPQPNNFTHIGDDDLVEGRHLSALQQEIANLKSQQQQDQYKNYALSVDNQLKSRHKDFDTIVTEANLIKLRDQEPEVFQAVFDTKDLYAKGVTAYRMLKKFGIVPDDDDSLSRIITNSGKPRASNSVAPQQSNSPLTKANPFTQGLTAEAKKALLKEMDDAIARL